MKKLFFIWLATILYCPILIGQEMNTGPVARVEQLYQEGHYKTALDSAKAGYPFSSQEVQQPAVEWWQVLAKLNFALGNQATAFEWSNLLVSASKDAKGIFIGLNVQTQILLDLKELELADTLLQTINQQYRNATTYPNQYHTFQNNLALFYLLKKEYSKALLMLEKAIKEALPLTEKNKSSILQSWRIMAEVYLKQQNDQDFWQQLQQWQPLIEKHQLENHPIYGQILAIKGQFLFQEEMTQQAIPIFQEVEAIYRRSYGANHPKLSIVTNNLGAAFNNIQDYKNGEKYLLKSLRIDEQNGATSIAYAKGLYNIGVINRLLGQYQKSIDFLIQAKIVFEQEQLMSDDFYAYLHYTLGQNYWTLRDTQRAIILYQKTNHLFQQNNLYKRQVSLYGQLGRLMFAKGNPTDAKEYFLTGIKLAKAEDLTESASMITLYKNYANYWMQLGKNRKAIKYLAKAKNICEQKLGKATTVYTEILAAMGTLYGKQRNHKLANYYFDIANSELVDQLKYHYPALSEMERNHFIKTQQAVLNAYFDYVIAYRSKFPYLTRKLQEVKLQIDGLGSENAKRIILESKQTKDVELQEVYHDWLITRKLLSKTYAMNRQGVTAKNLQLDSLKERVNFLEKDLGWNSGGEKVEEFQPTFKQLKYALSSNEVAIDFFQYTSEKSGNSKVIYGALLTRSAYETPKLILLSNSEEITKILNNPIKQKTQNYLTDAAKMTQLFEYLWQPIQPYLKDIETIHIVPTGSLHRLAFGTLASNKTAPRLANKYIFLYHQKLRDVIVELKPDKDQIRDSTALIIGGAIYNLDSLQLEEIAKNQPIKIAIAELPKSTATTRGNRTFSYLPGTKLEAEAITTLLKNENWQAELYTGIYAREEQLKQRKNKKSPTILHLATHGFFYQFNDRKNMKTNNLRENILINENPLFRSGLVFTGANYAWTSGYSIDGLEDGILTAFEIYNLDLSNTQLAVLSACESALGDIHQHEGVYGLQRAFKIAGVENLLISLWKVPDQATANLMQAFYQFYLSGQSPELALTNAQRQLMQSYPPYYWGAFIVLK